MQTVVGIRFKKAGKIYYFSPGKHNIKAEDGVIVETARGVEYGTVVIGKRDVPDSDIVQPLKSILRKATAEDLKKVTENREKSLP